MDPKRGHIEILKLDVCPDDAKWICRKITEAISKGELTMGENVNLFEIDFGKFIGTEYAIGTSSGTSALEIIYRCIDVKNREVIIPSNTFVATAYAAIAAGAIPIFADCNPETLCLSAESVRRKMSDKTAAVTIVHIGGIITPEIERIIDICNENSIPLIEDAAHAHGSCLGDLRAGSIGIAAAFSFYPTKVMTSCEGGMITTNNAEINDLAKKLRVFGQESRYVHTHFGYNWRLSELHAIVGLSQLRNLKKNLDRRREIASQYDKYFRDIENIDNYNGVQNSGSSYYKYIVKIRGKFYEELKPLFQTYNIELPGKVYDIPLHQQPIFKSMENQDLPGAEQACREHLCLPMYPKLTDDEVQYIGDVLKVFMS